MADFEKRSMKDRYNFHAKRAFENHKAAGSKMTKAEKAAYSAGYVKHAKQQAAIFKFKAANKK